VFFENDDQAVAALRELGCDVIEVPAHTFPSPDSFVVNDRPVVSRGSIPFVMSLNRSPWVPNNWLTVENFKCSTYYSYLNPWLYNQRYFMMPLADVGNRWAELCQLFQSDEFFIRPDSGLKGFSGGVFNEDKYYEEFKFWTKNQNGDPHALAVVAPPRPPVRETRLVIAGRKVISASCYRINGQLVKHGQAVENELTQEEQLVAERVLEIEWQPAPVYVLDLATDDRQCLVMEVNAFNTASLYGCDLQRVFASVNDMAIHEYAEYQI